ncbi:MAG: glycogen synthase [Gammaproteobacteria bacterium]|nr:glycogen synthase [Gammaproteobacteria bacterium]QOJ31019.1 MAG: glycogen synthase [Gammaproteobacteria bacterium]
MRILTVCAEYAPLAKVGGLGDVTAGLCTWLARRGHEVLVVMPCYGDMRARGLGIEAHAALGPRPVPGNAAATYAVHRLAGQSGGGPVPEIFVVDAPALFGGGVYASGAAEALRFMLLSRAALEFAGIAGFRPDIVHCHDWHAAPAVVMLKGPFRAERAFRQAYAALTIHNIGYQGVYPAGVLDRAGEASLRPMLMAEDPVQDDINFLRAGIAHADVLTTVSPTHAREIQTEEYGKGLDTLLRQRRHRLAGILNGVDYAHWDPASDPLLPAHYSATALAGKDRCRAALAAELGLQAGQGVPIVGMVSRLAQQKGIDILIHALPALLAERRFCCAILGSGEPGYVTALRELAARYPGRVAFVEAQDEGLAHRVYAGSDLFLVPSLYEPCGLTQMYAMRYGAVPVVRRTGGLADTVSHFDPATGQGTGSVFLDADVGGLGWGLRAALDWHAVPAHWARVVANGMAGDWSWEHQGPHYEALFTRLVNGGATAPRS